jgi:uncharacterized protein (UPF0147 family)
MLLSNSKALPKNVRKEIRKATKGAKTKKEKEKARNRAKLIALTYFYNNL